MRNRIFVSGTQEVNLQWVPPPLEKVVLDRLDLPAPLDRNNLCETRFHLWLWKNFFNVVKDDEFIGLFHQSYNEKFSLLDPPLQLVDLDIPTTAVLIACPSYQMRQNTIRHHPGMEVLLDEVCKRNHFDYWGIGLMTSTFIAHRTTWYNFLKWFRSEFDYWEAKYGDDLPFTCPTTNPALKPAYFYERLTSLWFSNSGLRITPLYSNVGHYEG